MSKNRRLFTILILHILLAVYSFSGVFGKLAAKAEFLSAEFFVFYGVILLLLGVYAVGWQQIIKRLPLTTAFANKAITVVWGIVWGAVFFSERITVGKIIGAVIVITGVVMYAKAGDGNDD